jgi:hypothetical protein
VTLQQVIRIVGAVLALSAGPAAAQTPLWRMDLSHLEADRAAVRACLEQADRKPCVDVVQRGCPGQTMASARQCEWRAIAAWEDEMAERLRTQPGPADSLRTAQEAWEASMLADVRYASNVFEGGSLQGLIAAHVRARALAQRVVWLEDRRREINGD